MRLILIFADVIIVKYIEKNKRCKRNKQALNFIKQSSLQS